MKLGLHLGRVLWLVGLLFPQTGFSHHSPAAAFDLEQVVSFEGTVRQFDWTNPHVHLVIETENNVEWIIETDAAVVMTRSGWTQDSFAVGDSVLVRANPARRLDIQHGLLLTIQGADGVSMASVNRTRGIVGSDTEASTSDLGGIWAGEQSITALMIGIADHPLTVKGEAAKAVYDHTVHPVVDCVSWPTPMFLGAAALYLVRIELEEDSIVLTSEFYNAERIIYMDGRGHPEDGPRSNQGHSIGTWEGSTLVVDTTLFTDHPAAYSTLSGIPSGAQKHVVERYTLSEDGARALIDILVEDPEYLAEPFTAQLVLRYSPHLEMLRLDCDLELARGFTR